MKKFLKFVLPAIAIIISYTACNNSDGTSVGVEKDSVARPMSNHNAAMMAPMDLMTSRMSSMRLTGDFDYDFAKVLIEHNRGAKGMAGLQIEKGTSDSLRKMANDILNRTAETEDKLLLFLEDYKPIAFNNDSSNIHYDFQDGIANTVVRMKGIMMTGNIDKDFAMMMIPHHEASNEILKGLLDHGKSLNLKQLANRTIAIQKRELDSLNVWAFENK